jgi:hypothetical protein
MGIKIFYLRVKLQELMKMGNMMMSEKSEPVEPIASPPDSILGY